jgi:hypothetical protein
MASRWLTSALVALAAASAVLVGDVAAASPAATAAPAVVTVAQQAPLAQQVPAAAPRRVAGTPCTSTARACVELSSNRAWLIRNGRVSYGPVPISHGRRGHRTPPGTFRVTFRNIDHVSSIYGTPMPYSVFFNGGIAFHQGDIRSGSAGCIRMQRAAAREFYTSLRRGDVVQVVR